jgi:hypothetical protein
MTRTAYARCPECRFHQLSACFPASLVMAEALGRLVACRTSTRASVSRSSGAGETGHNHLLAADNRGKFK